MLSRCRRVNGPIAIGLCVSLVLTAVTVSAPAQRLPEQPQGRQTPAPSTTMSVRMRQDPEPLRSGATQAAATPDPRVPPLEEPVDPAAYRCGSGDVFELSFWGAQNTQYHVTSDLEGRIFVPKLGYVPTAGLTLAEVRERLKKLAKRYYPRTEFDLTLAAPRRFSVHLAGAVGAPGAYIATPLDRVAAVLASAGGARGSRRGIEIRHRDGKTDRADLALYELTGDVVHNPRLLDGDVVFVPFEKVVVSVSGAVNRPGRHELTGASDLAEALMLAGGVRSSATRRLPIRVTRTGQGDLSVVIEARLGEGDAVPSVPLHDDDDVYVPGTAEVQQSVMVVGAVNGATAGSESESVKRVPFAKGDTVRSVVERLGGVAPTADLTGAYIQRGDERKGTQIPVDLEALLVRRDARADRPLRAGDVVVIPPRNRGVIVQGAVLRSGVFKFDPRYSADEYITLAGGLTRFARDPDEIKVVRADGEMRGYDAKAPVRPGDTIVVPERYLSRAEMVSLMISGAGILVSALALVLTVVK